MELLVGREAECGEFSGLFAAVAGDGAATLAFTGEPGIGKTALLREVERRAQERGFLVLRARAGALERDFGFGVVRQLFEPLLRAGPGDGRRRIAAEQARALRWLADDPLPETGGGSFADRSREAAELVTALCRREPVLLSVDDLHEADTASLRWLAYLSERIAPLPLALVVATCTGSPAEGALGELLGRLRTMRLGGLGTQAVRALVEAALPGPDPDALAAACREVSGGNPYLLREMLHALRGRAQVTPDDVHRLGPAPVGRAVLARLRRALPAAPRLARAVAVLGDGADPDAAGALARLTEEETERARRVLVRLGVLGDAGALRFTHPVVRASVAAEMTVVVRGLAHARAAELLHARGAPPERIADQLLSAQPCTAPWAGDVLRAAAAAASLRGAPRAAVAYLRRAVRLAAGLELRIALAEAEQEANLPEAEVRLAGLLAEAEDPRLRARVAWSLGRSMLLRDGFEAGMAVLGPELRRLAGIAPEEAAAEGGRAAAWARNLNLPPRLIRAWHGGPLRAAAGENPCTAALLAHQEAESGGSPRRAVELARRALADGLPLGRDERIVAWTAVGALLAAERLDEVEAYCAAALRMAAERGATTLEFLAHSHLARAALIRGRLAQAVRSARAGRAALARLRYLPADRHDLGFTLDVLTECLVERGDLDEVEDLLARHGFGDGHPLARPEQHRLAHARGRLRLARGDAGAALTDFRTCGGQHDDTTGPAVAGPWRGYAALAHLRLGRPDEAARLAARELDLARRWGTPYVLGNALITAAECLPGRRRELLEEAVALLAPSPCRYTLAAAVTALGETVLDGEHARGVELLYQGFELATACEGAPVLGRARALLRGAGLRPKRPRNGAAALTAREREILEFALRGLSNGQIADLHFLTRRTVEQHLTRGYRKLGITGRRELTDALLDGAP
ncbi:MULTISPECIES: ATP-binding protein [Streptomyces]|uniref:ATP-binding protein n=1 Tax=Streptomyces ramulosus TaxID=47762 RepID=A0ABW1FN23_9ACTN